MKLSASWLTSLRLVSPTWSEKVIALNMYHVVVVVAVVVVIVITNMVREVKSIEVVLGI